MFGKQRDSVLVELGANLSPNIVGACRRSGGISEHGVRGGGVLLSYHAMGSFGGAVESIAAIYLRPCPSKADDGNLPVVVRAASDQPESCNSTVPEYTAAAVRLLVSIP